VDPEPLHRLLDQLQHLRDRIPVEQGEIAEVLAVIPVLGRLLTAPDRVDGGAEAVHLRARVVVVVLAPDLVTAECEEARDGVSVRAVPRRGDRDRARRVGRDHLHLDPLARAREAAAVLVPLLEHVVERLAVPGRREPQVHEAGPRHLGALDGVEPLSGLGDLCRQLARRPAALRGLAERDVRREVAVLRTRRALERDGRSDGVGELRLEAFHGGDGAVDHGGVS
jgi:hypothetical protein